MNQKTKVVHLIARLNTGGPARHVVWLAADLIETGFDAVLACGSVPPGEGDMSYFARQNGVEPVVIPEMSRELSPKDAVSLWKVYRLLRRERPEIIHTHTAKAGTLGRVAGFFYRWLTLQTLIGKPRSVRFVHTYHGHVFHSYYGRAKTLFFLTVERVLARAATDRILVLSEQQRREIAEDFRVGRAAQYKVVPLAIDLESFENHDARRHIFRRELNAAPNEILIGIVGRLTEVKNHQLFLRAAKLTIEKIGAIRNAPRIRFIVVGDGHLRDQLERAAAELGLDEKTVVFAGERRDPENFYAALDIVALTSLNEGTPLTLLEAMASRRPTVSTAVGGTIDLLGAKSAKVNRFEIAARGILVESENHAAFCDGLIALLENPVLRREIAERAAEFVRVNFSRERLLADIEALYGELLGAPPLIEKSELNRLN